MYFYFTGLVILAIMTYCAINLRVSNAMLLVGAPSSSTLRLIFVTC